MYTAQENLEDWNQFGSNSLVARKCLWYFAFCKWVVRAVSLSSPPQRKQSTTAPELSGALQEGVCQMCHLTLWRQNSYSWKNSSLPTGDFSKTCFSQEVITTIKASTALLSMKWTKILQIPLWLRLMVIDFISCKQQTRNLSIWEMQSLQKLPTVKFQKLLCVSYLLSTHSQFSLFPESISTEWNTACALSSEVQGNNNQASPHGWQCQCMFLASSLICYWNWFDICPILGIRATKIWLTWMWILAPRQWLVAALVPSFI